MFAETTFPLPAEVTQAGQIRPWIAKRLPKESPLARDLFHYTPNGNPCSSWNPFRVSNSPREGRIVAMGREAVAAWLSHLPDFSEVLGKLAPGAHTRVGQVGAEIIPKLVQYSVYRMVFIGHDRSLRRKLPENGSGNANPGLYCLSDEEVISRLTSLIRRDLNRQASALELSLEEDTEIVIGDVRIAGTVSAVDIHGARANLMVREVSFRSNLQLTGPWAVGHLQGRGYGTVRPTFSYRHARN